MEWTLDQDRLYESPLMTEIGQVEIRKLSSDYGVRIPSLTGIVSCNPHSGNFQAPRKKIGKMTLYAILDGCASVG